MASAMTISTATGVAIVRAKVTSELAPVSNWRCLREGRARSEGAAAAARRTICSLPRQDWALFHESSPPSLGMSSNHAHRAAKQYRFREIHLKPRITEGFGQEL
jgi:hypothetical protein